jgi:hypothetical protein
MILRQYLHVDPVAASYLFGCGGRAAAAVVDPIGEIGPYIDAADETGMRILYVIDTHLHADHISSGRDLARATGADCVLFADAQVAFPFRGVCDGEILALGNVAIEILHSPGHRPSTSHFSLPIGPVPTSRGLLPASSVLPRSPTMSVWPVSTGRRRRARPVSERIKAQGASRLSGSVAGRVFRLDLRAQPERQAGVHDRV